MKTISTLRRCSSISSLEPLESRIAPAQVVSIAPTTTTGAESTIIRETLGPQFATPAPDVQAALTDAFYGPEVAHNAPVTYHVGYVNSGNATATGVVLHFYFPNDANTSGLDNPGWTDPNNDNDYQYTIGTVTAGNGGSADFHLRAGGFMNTNLAAIHATANVSYDGGSGKVADGTLLAPALANEAAINNNTTVFSPTATRDTPVYQGIYAVASGVAQPGHFATTEVRVFDVHTGQPERLPWLDESGAFRAYPDVVVKGKTVALRDSVRVAVGDFNGDGFDDIAVATAHGIGPVKVFDGVTGEVIKSLAPFNGKKGLFIAAGDVTGDLVADLVLGSALGGGSVKVYDGATLAPVGQTFNPFPKSYVGGVRVAVANFDPFVGEGINKSEIVTAEGNFGNKVNVYNVNIQNFAEVQAVTPIVTTIPATFDFRAGFTVGGAHYRGGLNVTAGDLDGDGRAEIVVGRNRLSSPIVEIWHLAQSKGDRATVQTEHFTEVTHFTPFSPSFQQGVRVAIADVNGDGVLDIITAAGFSGKGMVHVYLGDSSQETNSSLHFTYDPELAFKAFSGNQPAIWAAGTNPIFFATRDVDYTPAAS